MRGEDRNGFFAALRMTGVFESLSSDMPSTSARVCPRNRVLPPTSLPARRGAGHTRARVSKKLKNIGIVSLLTIISRFLGVTRDLLSAAIFGAGMTMDAFVTAFSLPNLFRRLLGEGALTA